MNHNDWMPIIQWVLPLILSFLGGHKVGTNAEKKKAK